MYDMLRISSDCYCIHAICYETFFLFARNCEVTFVAYTMSSTSRVTIFEIFVTSCILNYWCFYYLNYQVYCNMYEMFIILCAFSSMQYVELVMD